MVPQILLVQVDFLLISLLPCLERSGTVKMIQPLLTVVKLALSYLVALSTAKDSLTIGISDNKHYSLNHRGILVIIQFVSRIIVDGPESGTVFNGPVPLLDAMYTSATSYITGNIIPALVLGIRDTIMLPFC